MILTVKAKHFKGTDYLGNDGHGCALDKAAMDQFKLSKSEVNEGVDGITISNKRYTHIIYDDVMFEKDKEKARKVRYNSSTIRRIRLNP